MKVDFAICARGLSGLAAPAWYRTGLEPAFPAGLAKRNS